MKNSLVLLVVMVVLTGLNLSRPVESAQPAIVNPIGYDKPAVIKHLNDIITVCKEPKITTARLTITIMKKVCELPSPIYAKLDKTVSDFYKQDPVVVAEVVRLQCETFQGVLK